VVISDALPVQFWSVDTDTYNEKDLQGVFKRCFCHPWNCDDIIKLQVDFEILDAIVLKIFDEDGVELQSIPFTNTIDTVYSVSFSPSTYDLCDDLIQLKIYRGSTALYKSDCLDIKPDHDETVEITYSNNRNFASINYSLVTPDPEFKIRIPACFVHERFPEEDEVIELSNSRSIQLNAQVKAQRLLEVKSVPYYMHRKLKLILKHQFITIDFQDWVKSDPYEEGQSNRRNVLRQATVWLTEKDYIIRNVL
jgi:hypothetical protein